MLAGTSSECVRRIGENWFWGWGCEQKPLVSSLWGISYPQSQSLKWKWLKLKYCTIQHFSWKLCELFQAEVWPLSTKSRIHTKAGYLVVADSGSCTGFEKEKGNATLNTRDSRFWMPFNSICILPVLSQLFVTRTLYVEYLSAPGDFAKNNQNSPQNETPSPHEISLVQCKCHSNFTVWILPTEAE